MMSKEEGATTLFPVLSSARVKKPTETERRLPSWLSHPKHFPAVNLYESAQDIDDFSEFIDADLIKLLKKQMNIDKLFPVQKCLIPCLHKQFASRPFRRPNDICVSSPTGSGKTLAFAIPIVNYLKKDLTRSLRALVVLPSRDLAQQVYKAFNQICHSTPVHCALATEDRRELLTDLFKRVEKESDLSADQYTSSSRHCSILRTQCIKNFNNEEYTSNVDILISTPGVLTDLIHNVPGCPLKDLEILVIDEADRLMTSHNHDWLNTIERSIFSQLPECPCDISLSSDCLEPDLKRQRLSYSSTAGCAIKQAISTKPLHKLLFSATLSSDPQLLLHMNLFQPRLYLATRPSITGSKIRHSLGSQNNTPTSSPVPQISGTVNTRSELLTSSAIPDQLEEKMFVTEAKEKLFIMWYLFHEVKYKKVICFTNTIQTNFRLCKFLNEIPNVRAVEYSSNLKPETRTKFLNEFKNDRLDVLVSTDIMARGMDVDGVDYVISYDMPTSEIFYVHRIGRTARAGKRGTAITLVDTKQLVLFKRIVQLAHKMPNSMRLSDVVEEMKVPIQVKKNPQKNDLYAKTLEDYEDKLNSLAKKRKAHQKK